MSLLQHDHVVVISDLHVGSPKSGLDDFNRDEDFDRLLREVVPVRAGWPASLVINGDFIDFAQVRPDFGRPRDGVKLCARVGCSEAESRQKIDEVIEGHPQVFAAMRSFIERGGQVLLLPGNHDIDLHWGEVQAAFHDVAGGVQFVGAGRVHERGVYIEHGNQYSEENRFEFWSNPFVQAPDGSTRLERPFGTLFLDAVFNDIKMRPEYRFVDKVHPRGKLLGPLLRAFMKGRDRVPETIGRLLAFFWVTRGQWSTGGVLGEEAPSAESMEALLAAQNVDLDADTQRAVLQAADRFLEESGMSIQEADADDGLLGNAEQEGVLRRARELLESEEATIAVFGHTHQRFDDRLFKPSDPRRYFNPGSWTPHLPWGPDVTLSWDDLRDHTEQNDVHDIRYVRIRLGENPTGVCESLLP